MDDWPVVIAVLGPLMLKLAAERTAGAVPYDVTPEHTRGARAALGPDKLLAVEQKVCLQTDSTAARGLARRELHRYPTIATTGYVWASQKPTSRMAVRTDLSMRWCSGAIRDDYQRPEGPSGSGRHSTLHSAGPCGGRHGSARPNPDGARRCLSLLKQLFTADAVAGNRRFGPVSNGKRPRLMSAVSRTPGRLELLKGFGRTPVADALEFNAGPAFESLVRRKLWVGGTRLRLGGTAAASRIAMVMTALPHEREMVIPLRSIEKLKPICRPRRRSTTPFALVSRAADLPPAIDRPAPTAV